MSVSPQDSLLSAYFAKREALRRTFTAKSGIEAADDLLQELYLRLLQTAPDGEILNVDAYLYRLAFNLMIDQRRSGARRQVRDERWRQATVTDPDGVSLAPDPDADRALIAKQGMASVLTVVSRLPEQTQRVFRLHKLEELSYREVAARLRISVSAVEKHMSRALRRIMQDAER